MNAVIAEKVKYGQNSRVFAVLDDGDHLRMVCLGDFNDVRYQFNQMACLAGAMLMEQLQSGPSTPHVAGTLPPGAWLDRATMKYIASAADVYALAGSGPSDGADTIGAMVRMNMWPEGTESVKGTKHLCSSMSEIGDLFFKSKEHPFVRAGRAQERSAVKRVEEALVRAKRLGYAVADEPGLLTFMERYAAAKSLQIIHTVDLD